MLSGPALFDAWTCQVFNPFLVAFGEQERQGAGGDADGDGDRPPPASGGGSSSSGSSSALEETARRQQPSRQQEEASTSTTATPAAAGEREPSTAKKAAAAAAAAAAAGSATTPGTLRQEGEAEETALPGGGGLVAGGLVEALPANVGLMTLMQLVEGEGGPSAEGPWEELSHAARARPARERNGRLTLLVRKTTACSSSTSQRMLGELASASLSAPPHESRSTGRNQPRRVSL